MGLTRTFGDRPDRAPPTPQKIGKLREKVAEHLGLAPAQAEASHPGSPWKFAVVRKVQSLVGDPDHHVADWLEEGAPLGVRVPIPAGSGAYPLLASPAESTPEEALSLPALENHTSFREKGEFEEPPGQALIEEHLNKGFGILFSSRAAAEEHLGGSIATAPLGCVSRQKETGQWKHRVVMDLKLNGVNAASSTPERQVLPSVFDHAWDLATLAASQPDQTEIETMVLDFSDAFMSIPLAGAERPFNTCEVSTPIRRTRPPPSSKGRLPRGTW